MDAAYIITFNEENRFCLSILTVMRPTITPDYQLSNCFDRFFNVKDILMIDKKII